MNKYFIVPITRRLWNDATEEYEDTYELEGYEVRDSLTGIALGFGETRDEALVAASRAILLPTRRLAHA